MLTHKESSPEMVGKNSNQGGLRLDERKVQMGLSQSDSRSLPKSIQTAAIPDSRRVLSGVQVQPQLRDSLAQWPSTTKTQDDRTQRAAVDLWRHGDLSSECDLGSRRLSVLGSTQSAVAPVATVGDQTQSANGRRAKATVDDQPGNHRPAAPGEAKAT